MSPRGRRTAGRALRSALRSRLQSVAHRQLRGREHRPGSALPVLRSEQAAQCGTNTVEHTGTASVRCDQLLVTHNPCSAECWNSGYCSYFRECHEGSCHSSPGSIAEIPFVVAELICDQLRQSAIDSTVRVAAAPTSISTPIPSSSRDSRSPSEPISLEADSNAKKCSQSASRRLCVCQSAECGRSLGECGSAADRPCAADRPTRQCRATRTTHTRTARRLSLWSGHYHLVGPLRRGVVDRGREATGGTTETDHTLTETHTHTHTRRVVTR